MDDASHTDSPLVKALLELAAAVRFQDQVRAAARAGEPVTAIGASRDAREWIDTAARQVAQVSQDQKQAPDGDWLWFQLMRWCKGRGLSPTQFNDLFEIVGRAREARGQQPVPWQFPAPAKRTPAMYAIEHAGYMATAAKELIARVNQHAVAVEALEEADDGDIDAARATLNAAADSLGESLGTMRERIYEFEKRRDRALRAAGQALPLDPETAAGFRALAAAEATLTLQQDAEAPDEEAARPRA